MDFDTSTRAALPIGRAATSEELAALRNLKARLAAIKLTVFDLENLQIVANGCPAHPAYRARHGMDLPSCDVCAKVFAARAALTVAGLLQAETK